MNTAVAGALPARSEGRYFYLWMAGVCVCVAFGGFILTFWSKVAAGTFHAPPMVYVHGALFSVMMCSILATQLAVLDRRPRLSRCRRLCARIC